MNEHILARLGTNKDDLDKAAGFASYVRDYYKMGRISDEQARSLLAKWGPLVSKIRKLELVLD